MDIVLTKKTRYLQGKTIRNTWTLLTPEKVDCPWFRNLNLGLLQLLHEDHCRY